MQRPYPCDRCNMDEGSPVCLQDERCPGKAPSWWKCETHGPAKAGAWGCPECVREMRAEIAELEQERITYFLERNSARDAWRRRVKQCEALAAMLAKMDAAGTRLMAALHVERMTENLLADDETPAMVTAHEAMRAQLKEAWRDMVDVLGAYKVTQLQGPNARLNGTP